MHKNLRVAFYFPPQHAMLVLGKVRKRIRKERATRPSKRAVNTSSSGEPPWQW